MHTSFYERDELQSMGFFHLGNDVLISKKASIYGVEKISVGNNVRIDDFCILSGKIVLNDNIHIAAYSALYGGNAGIMIDKYSNISSRVCIYAVSDDYSGKTMTNPTIPEKYKCVTEKSVTIEKNVIVGSGSTILPGVILAEGTAIGSMSLCKTSTESWGIYAGIPIKRISERSKDLLKLVKEYENDLCDKIINA